MDGRHTDSSRIPASYTAALVKPQLPLVGQVIERRHMGSQNQTPDWKAVGAAIREARKAIRPKMSQADLGEVVGVTQAAISKIEQGATTKTSTLDAICDALNLDLRIIIGPYQDTLPEDIQDMVGMLMAMSEAERAKMAGLIAALPHMPTVLRNSFLDQIEYYSETYPPSTSDMTRSRA